MSYDGSVLEVKLDASRNITGFASVGIRLGINAPESFRISDMYGLQGGTLLGRLPVSKLPPRSLWNGANRFAASVSGLGMDFGIVMLMGSNSIFSSNDFLKSHPGASTSDIKSRLWGLELNRKWAAIFPQFYKWYFVSGEHYTYRRVTSLSLTQNSWVFGEPGAYVMGGVELKTNQWVKLEVSSGGHVYSAAYDWDSNPDTAIRSGTKQPFVGVRVPAGKTNSMRSYNLKEVTSLDLVKTTAYSRWYDHANKTLYFNWGPGNDSAYIYICEIDNCVNATESVFIAGCAFLAAKTDTVKIQSTTYASSRFAGLYQCTAGVSVGGNGAFAINDIDSELISCTADSHLNDGFNFHNSGTSLMVNCLTRCNGDDGISHHESCIGYVKNCEILYNYAACSVPAFGAKVWHINCNAVPALSLSSKNYSGTFACISGQGQSTEAFYDNCFIQQRPSINSYYTCQSQQQGTQATLYIHAAKIDNESIKLYSKSASESDVILSSTKMF